MEMPNSEYLMKAVIRALRDLGGTANVQQMYDQIIANENIPDSILKEKKDGATATVFSKRLTWARTHLKNRGYIINISWGEWSLTEKGKTANLSGLGRDEKY